MPAKATLDPAFTRGICSRSKDLMERRPELSAFNPHLNATLNHSDSSITHLSWEQTDATASCQSPFQSCCLVMGRQTKLMPFSASRILKKGKGGGAKEQAQHKDDAKQHLWLCSK